MKKKWYQNTGAKLLLAVIAAVSLTVAATGAGLLYGGAAKGIEAFDESEYTQSRGFARQMYEAASRLTAALTEYHDGSRLSSGHEDWVEEVLYLYEAGKTNLNYIYVDRDSGDVYTNTDKQTAKTFQAIQRVVERLESPEYAYMIVTPEEDSNNLNTESFNASVWRHMLDSNTENADYIFAVFVDKSFPVDDEFAQNERDFYRYADWLLPAMISSAAALLIFMVALGLLTAGTGRSNDDEEVHLNFFDRWYTEPAAVTVVGVGGIAIYISDLFMSDVVGTAPSVLAYMVAFGVEGLLGTLFFLWGWTSLVKRLKAHTFWKNSLIRKILMLLKKMLRFVIKGVKELAELFARNTVSRIKMALIFGGFCFFQFVVCAMLFGAGVVVMFFILAAADIAALFYLLKKARGREIILEGLKKITDGELQYQIPLEKLTGEQRAIAEYINRIGEGLDAAVENSMKNERMKTELITNVSHDIKTPLTSIVNYVDLLKRENPTDPKIKGYLDILEEKAQRLKTLTEDVVEASKASTGNISLEMTSLNFVELVQQVVGEFEERFQEKNLSLMVHFDDEEAIICADGRRLWRVLENVFGNAAKYAMENTRVYVEIRVEKPNVIFSMKNISAQPLNISADELTERFIRGDVSRNTEGSGLGLSIAKSLTELQGGEFRLYLDGDLFKVTIVFKAN